MAFDLSYWTILDPWRDSGSTLGMGLSTPLAPFETLVWFSNSYKTPQDEVEYLIKTVAKVGKNNFIFNLKENIVSTLERIAENKDKFSKLVAMRKISPESLKPIFDDRMTSLRKIIDDLFCELGKQEHVLSMINTFELLCRPDDPSGASEKFGKDPRLALIDETLVECENKLRDPACRKDKAKLKKWVKTLGDERNVIAWMDKMRASLDQTPVI